MTTTKEASQAAYEYAKKAAVDLSGGEWNVTFVTALWLCGFEIKPVPDLGAASDIGIPAPPPQETEYGFKYPYPSLIVQSSITLDSPSIGMTGLEFGGPGPAAIADSSIEARSMQFGNAITIYPDGRVKINPELSLDEASRAFWDGVIKIAPNYLRRPDLIWQDLATAPRDETPILLRMPRSEFGATVGFWGDPPAWYGSECARYPIEGPVTGWAQLPKKGAPPQPGIEIPRKELPVDLFALQPNSIFPCEPVQWASPTERAVKLKETAPDSWTNATVLPGGQRAGSAYYIGTVNRGMAQVMENMQAYQDMRALPGRI